MSTSSEIIAHVDGGSRGNPGPAAYGVAVETVEGQPVTAFAKFLGETTNNFAEYRGLLAALEYALSHGYTRLRVYTDSELMARQISGRYKVRSPELRVLHDQAQVLIGRLETFSIKHVYREQNREADRLANQAMDEAMHGPAPAVMKRVAPPQASPAAPRTMEVVKATFQDGVLRPHTQLPLFEGEEVELNVRRKKAASS